MAAQVEEQGSTSVYNIIKHSGIFIQKEDLMMLLWKG